MSERNSMDDWQLQEAPGTGDQWQLLDQEQSLPNDLQLQETPGVANQWQPVAVEEASGGRTGWILPSLIIVALLAVLGYIGWLALNGFEVGVPASPPPIATSADDGAADGGGEPGVVAVATAATEAPTATVAPATPTPASEPTASPTPVMIVQRILTVISPYGLNARLEAGGVGEAARVIETGATGVVVDEVADWVQIELESGELFWVSDSPELVEFATATVEAAPGEAPPVAAAPEAPVAADDTPGNVTANVEVAGGVNARQEPRADAAVITIVPTGAALPVIGVSEDAGWVQVTLDDGATGWISTEVVTVEGDLNSLAGATTVATPAEEAADDATVGETTGITGTANLTDTAAITGTETVTETATETVPSVEDALVTIDNLFGAIARVAPVTTADPAASLASGTELPALGRSADAQWIQVELADGELGWIFVGSILLNVEPESLPVVEP